MRATGWAGSSSRSRACERRDEMVFDALSAARRSRGRYHERRLCERRQTPSSPFMRTRFAPRDEHRPALIGLPVLNLWPTFRLLTEQHVHSLLPMSDLIAAMESALAKFSSGEVLQPIRSVLMVGPTKAYFGLMPAYVPSPASLGAKLVTVFGENHKKQLPSHLATILLLDPETGSLHRVDGRPLHHRGAHRRGLGRLGKIPGARQRRPAGDYRQRRPGAQPPRSAAARAPAERRAHLVAAPAEPPAVRGRHEHPRPRADRGRRVCRGRGARRRSDRARHLV